MFQQLNFKANLIHFSKLSNSNLILYFSLEIVNKKLFLFTKIRLEFSIVNS